MKLKPSLFLLGLTALALAGCGGGGESKTQIGILQFGGFEALIKAKDGFVDTINASEIASKVEIDIKNANAESATNTSMASTLASSKDLVYGIATPSASALKNAVASLGADTPVLFSAVTNAVGANLVKNLDEPEGNCTGVLDLGPIAKELEILTMFEGIEKVVSFYTSTEVNSVYQAEIAEEWMDAHHLLHERKTITAASEISAALASIGSDVDAVFLPTDDTIANSMEMIKTANEARANPLIIVGSDTGMINGCTFALGVDYYQCGVQAAKMAISIIKDKKAIKNIPVETCDTSSIFVNKTLAEGLNINVPESVLSIEGVTIL